MSTVAVIGAGMGGLAAAVELAGAGHDVEVFELADEPGGKVGTAKADGVGFDTGPSLLTMPGVLAEIFDTAGTSLDRELELVRTDPWFRYVYPDGVQLEIHHDIRKTLGSIEETLGRGPRNEFEKFLAYAKRVWEAAAPNFIFSEPPSIRSVFDLGVRKWRELRDIDPLRTMMAAIQSEVSDWHLRWFLARYATYVGSDPRHAPATLNCIPWLELGRGSWGVRGGMHRIARALERCARRHGAEFRYDTAVHSVQTRGDRIAAIETDQGRHSVDAVVANGAVRQLTDDLLDSRATGAVETPDPVSMSAWTAIVRAERVPTAERRAHTVLFPEAYEREFVDIFDRNRPPRDPTLYLCAQEKAHGRSGWRTSEPLFVMANAPPEPVSGESDGDWDRLKEHTLRRLRAADVLTDDDEIVWERTPTELARRFPGSRGAVYGAASNSRLAAFNRPKNSVADIEGLYLAGGGVHPGSGVPMCLQSGRLAASALRRDSEQPK